jgi:hypothetical protein
VSPPVAAPVPDYLIIRRLGLLSLYFSDSYSGVK